MKLARYHLIECEGEIISMSSHFFTELKIYHLSFFRHRHHLILIFLHFADASSSQQRRRRRSSDDFGSASPTTDPTNNEDYENWFDWEGKDYVDYDAEYLATEKVALLMAEEDKSVLSSLGHQFEDMVLSCTFRGIQCRYCTYLYFF